MQSKFGVRPAPRKRPWLCKASPAALPVPAVPGNVLATFVWWDPSLVPAQPKIARTIAMINQPIPGLYYGQAAWIDHLIEITWYWQINDPTAWADVSWDFPAQQDAAVLETKRVQPFPHLRWYQNATPSPTEEWIVNVEVTS